MLPFLARSVFLLAVSALFLGLLVAASGTPLEQEVDAVAEQVSRVELFIQETLQDGEDDDEEGENEQDVDHDEDEMFIEDPLIGEDEDDEDDELFSEDPIIGSSRIPPPPGVPSPAPPVPPVQAPLPAPPVPSTPSPAMEMRNPGVNLAGIHRRANQVSAPQQPSSPSSGRRNVYIPSLEFPSDDPKKPKPHWSVPEQMQFRKQALKQQLDAMGPHSRKQYKAIRQRVDAAQQAKHQQEPAQWKPPSDDDEEGEE